MTTVQAAERVQSNLSHLLRNVGPTASRLKKRQILLVATLIAAVVAAFVAGGSATFLKNDVGSVEPLWPWLGFGAVAAVAMLTAADKCADIYDSAVARQGAVDAESDGLNLMAATERVAAHKIGDLLPLLAMVQKLAFQQSGSGERKNQMEHIRDEATRVAANILGDRSVVIFYQLSGPQGLRRLGPVSYGLGRDRHDQPLRPFEEEGYEELVLWRALDRADTESVVVRSPAEQVGLDWSGKPYVAFLNVPVRAFGLAMGMLSGNSSDPEAIGVTERQLLVVIARTLALAEAWALGVYAANARLSAVSGVETRVNGIEQLDLESQEGGDS